MVDTFMEIGEKNFVLRLFPPQADSIIRLFFILLITASVIKLNAQTHPFLIVTEDMYPDLQARAADSPWREIKDAAENDAGNASYSSGGSWYAMQNVANSCALTYILNPSMRSACKSKILSTIEQWDQDINRLNRGSNENTVDPGSAFFMCVVALDIIHDDCSAQELAEAENSLEPVYQWFMDNNTAWRLNLYGVRMIWALYSGDTAEARTHADNYHDLLVDSYISEDSVWTQSTGYAWNRIGGSAKRTAKTYAKDVLEFTGFDRRYYRNGKVINMFRWFFHFVLNPFRGYSLFGDTGRFRIINGRTYTRTFSMAKFSPDLAPLSAWFLDGGTPEDVDNSFFPYVLMEENLPPPQEPKSAIHSGSGAVFREYTETEESLMGCIWSLTEDGGHDHEDANSIYIAGYGEHLIANCGTNYTPSFPGQTPDGDRWIDAHLQNVVIIGTGDNHDNTYGGGVSEGFSGDPVEYVSCSSGPAMANGHHQRNFLFVHPEAGKTQGYFILIDEVTPDNASDNFRVLLHPNTNSTPAAVQADEEYMATINARTQDNGGGEMITIFMGTPPSDVRMRDGYFGEWGGSSARYPVRFMDTEYETPGSGTGKVVTVLFPHDDTHPKAGMTRISSTDFSGVSVDHDEGVVDHVIESDGTSESQYASFSFQGVAVLWRQDNNVNVFYFVRKGLKFLEGAIGYISADEVSMFMRGLSGRIIAEQATSVTFHHPGVQSVHLDGSPVAIQDAGAGFVTINVPAGTHTVSLGGATAVIPASRFRGYTPGVFPVYDIRGRYMGTYPYHVPLPTVTVPFPHVLK
jgi:hypothetical protein